MWVHERCGVYHKFHGQSNFFFLAHFAMIIKFLNVGICGVICYHCEPISMYLWCERFQANIKLLLCCYKYLSKLLVSMKLEPILWQNINFEYAVIFETLLICSLNIEQMNILYLNKNWIEAVYYNIWKQRHNDPSILSGFQIIQWRTVLL